MAHRNKYALPVLLCVLLISVAGCKKKSDNTGFAITFSGTPQPGSAIIFHANAPAGYTFSWDFGDNSNSADSVPTHTYLTSGVYMVKLTLNNVAAYSATLKLFIEPALSFSWTGVRIPGDTVVFQSNTLPASTLSWDFGDGAASTLASPAHIYSATGSYTVKLVNKDNNQSVSKTLNVVSDPVYTSLMGGVRVWHDTLTSSIDTVRTITPYPDVSFAVNIIDPLTVSIGSDTLSFYSSNSYSLVFIGSRPGRIALILTFYFTSNRIIYDLEYQDSWAPWAQVYQTP